MYHWKSRFVANEVKSNTISAGGRLLRIKYRKRKKKKVAQKAGTRRFQTWPPMVFTERQASELGKMPCKSTPGYSKDCRKGLILRQAPSAVHVRKICHSSVSIGPLKC